MNKSDLATVRTLIANSMDFAGYVPKIIETTDMKLIDSLWVSLVRKVARSPQMPFIDSHKKKWEFARVPQIYASIKPGLLNFMRWYRGMDFELSDAYDANVFFGVPVSKSSVIFGYADGELDLINKRADARRCGAEFYELTRRCPKETHPRKRISISKNKQVLIDFLSARGVEDPVGMMVSRTGRFLKNVDSSNSAVIVARDYVSKHPGVRFSNRVLGHMDVLIELDKRYKAGVITHAELTDLVTKANIEFTRSR